MHSFTATRLKMCTVGTYLLYARVRTYVRTRSFMSFKLSWLDMYYYTYGTEASLSTTVLNSAAFAFLH